jgi:hypothetical protein
MATRIIEYGGRMAGDYPTYPAGQFVKNQTPITASTTHAESAAFDGATKLVIIDSDEDVYVNFGTAPVATTNDQKVYAKVPCTGDPPSGTGERLH